MSAESRRDQRKPLRLALNYRDASGGNFLFEHSTNISKGGIFIDTRTPLPVGVILTIRFQLPGQDEIEVEGEVVWVNAWREGESNPNPGMGIQWKKLTPKQHEIVQSIVKAVAILPD